MTHSFSKDVCVIGGGGHVGLPLAMTFASSGLRTVIYDTNQRTVDTIRQGVMPFAEEGADLLLQALAGSSDFEVESTPEKLADCRFLVLIVGTPVDEHLNPNFATIVRALDLCAPYLCDGQILILRSTVFPGISKSISDHLRRLGKSIAVSFCPERIAQGQSLRELRELPQIISAFDSQTLSEVRGLFESVGCECLEMEPMEAELCKLMTNAWRYIQFATVNQFYMLATDRGLDFDRILHGCRHRTIRAWRRCPTAGFAAGPCLVKDTMQLAAFSHNNFVLGHSAMLINEGLPAHLIELAKRLTSLEGKTAGILGMAFKAESDDPRESLSFKLRKLLSIECDRVLCTDPYCKDASFVSLEQTIAESDVLFLATPHKVYRNLVISPDKVVIDVWSALPSRQQDV